MESLQELGRWDDYRVWMRKYLKLMSGEREPFYVSKARIEFEINGKAWKGHAVLLGKKSRMLSQKLRQEGCLFLEGTAEADGKRVTIDGFGEKHRVGAERLFKKLKLGFEVVGAEDGAAATSVDPLEARWQARKAEAYPEIKAALKSERADVGELQRRARPMATAERAGDWARALEALEAVMQLLSAAPPVTAEENARLAALSPEELARVDLTPGDPGELFGEAYMEELPNQRIKGEGSPDLKALMREIEKGLTGSRRPEAMAELALVVGVPPTAAELDVDYGRFLVVRKQQTVRGVAKGADVDGLDEGMHPEFMASRSQLLFGKVLGDAFGIHPVFGSLLSPTGGLVGPGNWLVPGVVQAGHLAPDHPVALHGTVHDAAGYLHTFHGEGPGYDYRESPIELLGTDSPLSGQISGIAYWVGEVGADYVERRADAAVVAVEKRLKSARDAVAAEVDQAIEEAQEQVDEASRAARAAAAEVERAAQAAIDEAKKQADEAVAAAADEARRTAQGVGEAIGAARDVVARAAVETVEDVADAMSAARDGARRQLEAAWDFVWS